MAGDPSRPRRRDAWLVALLAVVLVTGLVYYGVRLARDEPQPVAADPVSASVDPLTTPSAAPSEAPSVAPSVGPSVEPAPSEGPTEREPTPGTCWDGATVADLRDCTLPAGVQGLAWVFPSFDPSRAACRENTNTDRPLEVVTSWVCSEEVLGQQVLVAYDQVADIGAADAVMHASTPAGAITEIPGAHGGRCLAVDTGKRPARITGWYEKYPYVVSVFAPTARSAERAWKSLVLQRPPQAVRGRPA